MASGLLSCSLMSVWLLGSCHVLSRKTTTHHSVIMMLGPSSAESNVKEGSGVASNIQVLSRFQLSVNLEASMDRVNLKVATVSELEVGFNSNCHHKVVGFHLFAILKRQLQLTILSSCHPLQSRVGQDSDALGPHLLRGPVRQVVWEHFTHVSGFLVGLDNLHVGLLSPVPQSTSQFTSQESSAKDGDGFGLPSYSLKVFEVLNLSEQSDLVLDFRRDIVQLGKILGFASCGNETLVITNGGAILQVGQLGLGVNPGDPLALQHTDASLGRFHQLLNGGVKRWQLKIQAPLPPIPLLEPELLHGCLVLIEPKLLAKRWPHVGQPVLITHYQDLGCWVL